ncbi:hypothetical protein CSQ96_12930 [Janthinobacterium sp. BJB412]|nr:hypothetical protein CSQ96_12930 [Janthinobacterium sp. BJB412]
MKKLLLLAAALPALAHADTGYYLVSVYDVEGQASLDYKYWNAHYATRTVAAPELGVGYGVTARWYTELYATWVKFNGEGARLSAQSWQNDYLLTQGQYAFDLALHTKVERPRERANGYGLEWGPVLQTEIGRTQFNLNLFFQRDYRAVAGGPTELAYQWQVKHRWKSWLQFGLQGFGEVGKWNDWLPAERQSHRYGPAVFGGRDVGGRELRYEAAYLVGKNSARTAKSFTMRVQYIF